jgi:hypothetical protein
MLGVFPANTLPALALDFTAPLTYQFLSLVCRPCLRQFSVFAFASELTGRHVRISLYLCQALGELDTNANMGLAPRR